MKILSGEEIRACDAQAMVHTPSPLLMEIAGREVTGCVVREFLYDSPGPVVILVGTGNNGGDGYVVARHLLCCGAVVAVFSVAEPGTLQGEAREKAKHFLAAGGFVEVLAGNSERFREACRNARVIVDALFGSGFHGALPEEFRKFVEIVNDTRSRRERAQIVAIDIPSGVDATTGAIADLAINADLTVAIQAAKLGHLIEPGASASGRILVVDVGIFSDVPGAVHLTRGPEVSCMLSRFHKQKASAHKGTKGHVLVIGGAAGKSGAAKLAGLSALRTGAGLATVVLPQVEQERFQFEQWEVMSASLPGTPSGFFAIKTAEELETLLANKDGVVIGPGFGLEESSASSLVVCLRAVAKLHRHSPLIVDADALTLLAQNEEVASVLPPGSILTPHPGEMARLLGSSVLEVESDRVSAAKAAASRFSCWVVLKGARTIIASPPTNGNYHLWMNPHVTSVLGTAGSGDVLSGVIAALVAEGATPMEACRAGVFAHGLAGVLQEERQGGPSGATAIDIIAAVGEAMNQLSASTERLRFPLPGAPLELTSRG